MEALTTMSKNQIQRNYQFNEIDLLIIPQIRNRKSIISKQTQNSYITTISHFNNYLQQTNQGLNDVSIKKYFEQNSINWRHSTFNQKRQAFITVLKNQAGIKDNYLLKTSIDELFQSIKKKKQDRAITEDEYLEKSEVDLLLGVADKRMSLIIRFLFSTGCRVSELINTRLIDCKENGKVVINILGKGEKSRDVFISKELFKDIRLTFQGKSYLFETSLHTRYKRQNLLKYIKKLGKKAGINKTVNNHIFRHSFAMYMLSLGKSIKQLSRYLGHSTVTVTIEYYTHGTFGSDITDYFDQ